MQSATYIDIQRSVVLQTNEKITSKEKSKYKGH